MPSTLQFQLRTPHAIVFDEAVLAVRVPTQSGQAGLRPGGEPCLSVVEPGLIIARTPAALRFIASAGGLLDARRERAIVLTPFAVVGDDGSEVLAALARALATPDNELRARKRLGELEQRILHELRETPPGPRERS
jgi:F0F1-type ATP synthase epsilon subunit